MKNTIVLKDSKKNESSLFLVEDITHITFSEAPTNGGNFFVRIYRKYGNSITMLTPTLQEAQNIVGQLNQIIRHGNNMLIQPAQPASPENAEHSAETSATPVAEEPLPTTEEPAVTNESVTPEEPKVVSE